MKVYCEKCGKEICCNGVLGLRGDCGLNNMNLNTRIQNGNLSGFRPFRDTKTNRIFCVCFDCWQKHKVLNDEQMFKIDCWKGLDKEFGNPSYRRGNI